MHRSRRKLLSRLALAAGLAATGCFDFHLEGPEDPAPLPLPRSVTVTVEYRQPSQCTHTAGRCNDAVIFYGSWMRQGEHLVLRPVAGRAYWVGTAPGVPVNFPPRSGPYDVRVYDPFMGGTSTGGFTGRRLIVGGEDLNRVEFLGRQDEHALVYVDDNGLGHNPY